MKVTVTQAAWFSDPARLAGLDLTDPEAVRNAVSLTSATLDMADCGWFKVGEATTTFDFTVSPTEINAKALAGVEAKLKEVQAEYGAKLNALEALKQSLLAIEA